MYPFLKKGIIFLLPFIVLNIFLQIGDLGIIQITAIDDKDWGSRKFILGLMVFSGAIVISYFIHLGVDFSKPVPRLVFKLSHHPSPEKTKEELRIRSHYVCAGCTGGAIGTMVGMGLLVSYLFDVVVLNHDQGILLFVLQQVALFIGLGRYIHEFVPLIRIFQHFALFWGLSTLIMSIDAIYDSFIMLMLVIPVILSFIGSRIFLSRTPSTN